MGKRLEGFGEVGIVEFLESRNFSFVRCVFCDLSRLGSEFAPVANIRCYI